MALTKLNNKAVANVTTLPVALGDMVLVSSATASSSASIEFSLGNYKEYKFFLVSIHAQNDASTLEFNLSTDSGSNYNVTKTSTAIRTFHNEADSTTGLVYETNYDLAQSTGEQPILAALGNQNDETASGYVHIFNPSSSVFVKHYLTDIQCNVHNDFSVNDKIGGYANTVSPITNIRFKLSSGNIDAGKILMYGIN